MVGIQHIWVVMEKEETTAVSTHLEPRGQMWSALPVHRMDCICLGYIVADMHPAVGPMWLQYVDICFLSTFPEQYSIITICRAFTLLDTSKVDTI